MFFLSQINRLFVGGSLLSLFIVLITFIAVPSAQSYESSLHNVYPFWFWFSLGVCFLLPIFYVLFFGNSKKILIYSKNVAWFLLSVSVLVSLMLREIPIIRGYLTYSAGDMFYHYGVISDLLLTGLLSSDNHYPFMHVFVAIGSQITTLSPEVISCHISTFLFGFLLLTAFIVGRRYIGDDRKIIVLISLLAMSVFGLAGSLTPNEYGFILVPFYVYIASRYLLNPSRNNRYKYLLFICTLALWFVHPEAVLYSALFIVLLLIVVKLNNYLNKCNSNYNDIGLRRGISLLILLVGGFALFFITKSAFLTQIKLISNIFSGIANSEKSVFSKLFDFSVPSSSPSVPSSSLSPSTLHNLSPDASLVADYNLFEIISLGIQLYGSELIIIISAFMFAVCLLLSRKLRLLSLFQQIILIFMLGFSAFALFNMLFGTTIGLNPGRMLKWVYLLSVFFISSAALEMIFSSWFAESLVKLLALFLLVSIIFTGCLNVSGMYGNPELSKYNSPVMKSERDTLELFFETRNDNYLVEETGFRQIQSRYMPYIYGVVNAPSENIRSFISTSNSAKSHFGYLEHVFARDNYDYDCYFILTAPQGEEYRKLFVNQKYYLNFVSYGMYLRFTNDDPTVFKIIDGGETSIYMLKYIN